MSDPFLRRLAALRHIPGSPASTTCTAVVEALRKQGDEATERTRQRNLVELATTLPIACDDQHGKPQRWSWLAGASLFDLPGMDAHTALAFALAEKLLEPLLPEASLRPLRRHFERARAVLGRELVSAEPSNDRRTVPAGFDLDRYLASGALGFALEEAPMRLVVRCSPLAARTILEAPPSVDQAAGTDADGWVHIEASVHDTVELRV